MVSGRVLRDGQSGAIIKAPAGYVLTSQADGTWLGAPPSGGGSVLPLSTVFYVDPVSAAATEDGSIAAPFKTLGAALDAYLLQPDGATLLLVPGDYSAEVLTANLSLSTPLTLLSLALGIVTPSPMSNFVVLPELPITGNAKQLTMQGCQLKGQAWSEAQLLLFGCRFAAQSFDLGASILDSCTVGTRLTFNAEARFLSCLFDTGGDVVQTNQAFQYFEACEFLSGAPGINFTGAAGVASMCPSTYANFLAAGGIVTNGAAVQRLAATTLETGFIQFTGTCAPGATITATFDLTGSVLEGADTGMPVCVASLGATGSSLAIIGGYVEGANNLVLVATNISALPVTDELAKAIVTKLGPVP